MCCDGWSVVDETYIGNEVWAGSGVVLVWEIPTSARAHEWDVPQNGLRHLEAFMCETCESMTATQN